MEFSNNRVLLFSIGILTIALAVILSMKNLPDVGSGNSPIAITGNPEPDLSTVTNTGANPVVIIPTPFNTKKLNSEIVIEAGDSILFAQKAACRMNVSLINSTVERWYLMHNDQWPKTNLSDIARDNDYFPQGIPPCPVDGTDYFLNPETHRIAGHLHPEIPEPEYLRALQSSQRMKYGKPKSIGSGNTNNEPASDKGN